MDEMLLQIEQAYEKTDRLNEKLEKIKVILEDYLEGNIEVKERILQELNLEESLEMIIHSMPTVYKESLGAVDAATGQVIGMTENNSQGLEIEGITEKNELLNILEDSHKTKLLKINGTYQFLKTQTIQDSIILFTLFQSGQFFKHYSFQMFSIGLIIVCFSILMSIELKRYIKKYILKDFLRIEEQVRQFIHGEKDIRFKSEYDTELRALSSVLNDWKDDCNYKTQRIIRIVNILSSHVAVFECLYNIQNYFFTSNMAKILGLSEEEWKEIRSNPKGFEIYINELLERSRDKEFIYVNDKILNIKSFKIEDEFYGLIVDRTQEIHSAHQIEDELQRMRETADKDTLTDLYNRHALEERVKKGFKSKPDEGILLIFDLDNFKPINDLLGHPEGDKVLKIFAETLKANFRKKDMIARLGGDEFVVYIDTSLSVQLLEHKLNGLLKNIRHKLNDYYTQYNISTSIGVAYVDYQINSYEELYKCADVALYIAKRMGKDRYFINEDNIRCMRGECMNCKGDCKKRKALGL